MGLINRTNTNPDTAGEKFVVAGDDYLKEYIAEIDRPKQAQTAPEIPLDDDFEPEGELVEPREPSKYEQRRGNQTARFAVTTVDKIIASIIAVYAHSDTVDEFQADDEEINDLVEQWGVYFTESNLDLPPWIFALITTGFVLLKKFKAAGSVRKINIERNKFKQENEALKIQLELLQGKNQVLELRKKVEEMEGKAQ